MAAVGVHAAAGDPARRHGVDAHAGMRPLEGGGHRQVAHAGARGAAVRHAGHAVAEVGRHVDDRAAVLLHALVEDLAHHQEAAGQVVGHHGVEALLADGQQRRRELPAGVVDQAVHRAVPRDDLAGHAGLHRVFVADVEGQRVAAAAVGGDLGATRSSLSACAR
jgi:hypothetical protein